MIISTSTSENYLNNSTKTILKKIILTTRTDYHQNMQQARLEGVSLQGVCVFFKAERLPHTVLGFLL